MGPWNDAALMNWYGDWRMPTDAELTELREKCTWKWTIQKGINGYEVTCKSNGNSIFLPAAGCRWYDFLNAAGSDGLYWSGALIYSYDGGAYYLEFGSGDLGWNYDYRVIGRSVRPVCQ